MLLLHKRIARVQLLPRLTHQKPKAHVRTMASWQQVVIDQSYYIGKGLTLFVLFTSTLNWIYYRKLREKLDDDKKENDENKG